MQTIICKECGDDFNPNSLEKKKAGGYYNTCPECSEEHTVRYLGLQSADGKQSQATILKFDSPVQRDEYLKFWQNNSGLHKNKACQLGRHLSTTPKIKFTIVQNFSPTNHKGKAV